MANKMADKKKNASQNPTRSQMAEPKVQGGKDQEQSKDTKPVAREQDGRKERQSKTRRESSSDKEQEQSKDTKPMARERDDRRERQSKPVQRQSKGPSATAIRLRNNRAIRFALDAYYELRHKVTWPTFEEARNMTIAVLLLSAAVGALLSIADIGLFQLFRLLSGR